MENAWVLNQEILINPELYHPCKVHNGQPHTYTRDVFLCS